MGAPYVPERGDVVWLSFAAVAGHEQDGRRPATVLHRCACNVRTGLMLACPVTRRAKGYRFEIALPDALGVEGVVLADRVRRIDWRARGATLIAPLPPDVTDDVAGRLLRLLA